MTPINARPADRWSPLYFLASVGAGGIAVTFFMYLMFWVPHPNATVPVFEDIMAAWGRGNLAQQIGIAAAMTMIAVFGVLNIRSLIWNLGQLARFRRTPAYEKLRHSNAETQLLAMPLALAMTVNVGFIIGLVYVPNLWAVVEYLFPAAMVAFVMIGGLALRMVGHFLGRVMTEGGIFDVTANNSFAQLLPAFALAMVAVGLSAPAALSTSATVVAAALTLSTFFGVIAALYAVLGAVTALNSMLHYGTSKEASPTLMIIIPLMTVLGILILRQNHGMHTTFEGHTSAAGTFRLLSVLLTIQVMFAMLGWVILRRHNYASTYLTGSEASPGSYALVCPGVALTVMGFFWINKGLVEIGAVDKFGAAYWALTAVVIAVQLATIALVLLLNRKHLSRVQLAAVPAE